MSSSDCKQNCDNNYYRFVGWEFTQQNNPSYSALFNKKTVIDIQAKLATLLQGVDRYNRPIIVSEENICNIMSEVFSTYRPPTGDIHSRYIVPSGFGEQNMVADIIDKTIQVIFNTVKNELLIEQNNEKLTIWTTVYGDFNTHGLRQHAPIKTQNKHPDRMQFNMNY